MKKTNQDTPMTLEEYSLRQNELKKSNTLLIRVIVGLVVTMIIAGTVLVVTKLHSQKSPRNSGAFTNQQSGPGNGAPNGRMGGFGEVTAITESSITIKDAMNDTEKTYSISDSTTVTDDSGSVNTVSGIKVGDQVMVRSDTASSNDESAASITFNPQMPSGPRSNG
ncbi:MAG: hypothetical protein WAR37_03830 [Candidatus Microsaccharimonas sp.]